jgi:hypothetical protein
LTILATTNFSAASGKVPAANRSLRADAVNTFVLMLLALGSSSSAAVSQAHFAAAAVAAAADSKLFPSVCSNRVTYSFDHKILQMQRHSKIANDTCPVCCRLVHNPWRE